MAFEYILQPLLDARMIKKTDSSNSIKDIYIYTREALNLIGVRYNWHFCDVTKNVTPAKLRVWLPTKHQTDNHGEPFGGFDDSDSYRYIIVKDNQTDLYGTEFEERVEELFNGLGVPYEGFNDDYIELDDLCL